MLGLHVTVPIACWRKGLAREYLETEDIPPPATCYGFLLSLVGETDRLRHRGCRVTAALLTRPQKSVVLRTVWRVKQRPLGSTGNTRPDYQQILSGSELLIWLDSNEEQHADGRLEDRVIKALDPKTRDQVERYGGLSLGESTHLVDSVSVFSPEALSQRGITAQEVFLLDGTGRLSLPVWVDHVGSARTGYAVGRVERTELVPPNPAQIPRIE